MRIPTFSRQSEPDTAEAERPVPGTAAATDTAPVRPRREPDQIREPDQTTAVRPTTAEGAATVRTATAAADKPPLPPPPAHAVSHRADPAVPVTDQPTVGRKPRSSLLATLGLMLGVAAVLLVLSGPLLGYGIGVAGLALVLSLSGIHATGKRHVAGKTDALIGMVLALGAIVLGVLALTGSLSWLGTDVQPVNSLREWLDTQFIDRFRG